MGMISWWFVPEDAWLSRRGIARVLDATEGKDVEGSGASSIEPVTDGSGPSGPRVHQE